jgi:hypothetical protein
MGINLWLDDVRPAPPGWLHVKTAHEAASWIASGRVMNASLDHDLGPRSVTGDGTQLVLWMVETNLWPKYQPRVHSANPAGAMRMRALIRRYGPY